MKTSIWASQFVPWTDKKGRLHLLRAVVFGLLLVPGLSVAVRLGAGLMGGRPVNAAIHSTGYWAVVLLVASLIVHPLKVFLRDPGLIVVRRMIGNAALFYAAIHLVLYCVDQNWHMLTVIREIAVRFYLTIGFVALLGLIALGVTSTDGWVRRLGRNWKRLHRAVYGIAVLALIHFILQTKADVSLPLLFVGVFAWLMMWRALPAGLDRQWLSLVGLTLAAALLTLGAEWTWYRFGTHVDPMKVLRAEADLGYGPGPGGQVIGLGMLAMLLILLHRLSQGWVGQKAWFWVPVFVAGAGLNEFAVYLFEIDRFLDPSDWSWLYQDLAWAVLLGVLGSVRWRCGEHPARHAVDLLGLGCVAFQIMLSASGLRGAGIVLAVAIASLWAILAWQAWPRTKLAAISLLPVCLVLAYGVSELM